MRKTTPPEHIARHEREFYTRQEPDGRIVHVRTKYVEDREFGCGPGTLNERYCCRPDGIIRIVEIIVALVIVSLITSVFGPGPFKGILFGQTLLIIFDGVAMCITFIFLVVYFFNLHETHLRFWPWSHSDCVFSVIASVLFLMFGLIESYYSTGAWSNNCNDIGGDGVIHNGCRLIFEWAFSSFFCFVNSIFYAFSAFLANRSRHYEYAQNY